MLSWFVGMPAAGNKEEGGIGHNRKSAGLVFVRGVERTNTQAFSFQGWRMFSWAGEGNSTELRAVC